MDTSKVVRLSSIDIKNLGNVTTGHLDLDKPNKYGNNGSVIGVYGQNGTGKSTMVQALYLIRQLIQGENVAGKKMSANKAEPVVECRFQIYNDCTQEICNASYSVTWHSNGNITRETLAFSFENPNECQRKTIAFDTALDSTPFAPKSRREKLVNQYTEDISHWWQSLSKKQQLEWAQKIVLLLFENNSPIFPDLIRALIEYTQIPSPPRDVDKKEWINQFPALLLEILFLLTPESLANLKDYTLDDVINEITVRSTETKVDSEIQKRRDILQKSRTDTQLESLGQSSSWTANLQRLEQQTLNAQRNILKKNSALETVKGFIHEQKDYKLLDFMNDESMATEAQRFRLRSEIILALQRFLHPEADSAENEPFESALLLLQEQSDNQLTEENVDAVATEFYMLLTGVLPGVLSDMLDEAIKRHKLDIPALLTRMENENHTKSKSFIFSPSLRLWASKYLEPRVSQLLDTLYDFALHHWYIVESLLLADSMSDEAMVLHYPRPLLNPDQTQVLSIPLSGSVIWAKKEIALAMESLVGINEVLGTVMPGVEIKIITMNETDPDHAEIAFRSVLSDGSTISLGEESAGVRRMISIVLLLNAMYCDPSTTVVIDELDAFLFEHLLGQILQVLNQNGKGQLIFTSHNLHLLEVLGNRCIAFTGQNQENRYIHIKNIKSTNNLRDVYMGQVKRAKSDHPLCKPTNIVDIKNAFDSTGKHGTAEERLP